MDRPPGAGETGILKVSAIRFDEFAPTESKALPHEDSYSPKHLVAPGDILISRANGSLSWVGAVCQATPTETPLLLSDKTLRLVPDDALIDRRYLVHVLLSSAARTQIERDATGSSGQKNISQNQMKSFTLPYMPPHAQREVAAVLDALASELSSRKVSVRDLASLRHGLLSSLLSGETEMPEVVAEVADAGCSDFVAVV